MAQVKKIGRSFHTFYFRIEEKTANFKDEILLKKKLRVTQKPNNCEFAQVLMKSKGQTSDSVLVRILTSNIRSPKKKLQKEKYESAHKSPTW